jgi:hypothetical protein
VTEEHIISDQTADCNKGCVDMFADGCSIHVFFIPYCCQTLTFNVLAFKRPQPPAGRSFSGI